VQTNEGLYRPGLAAITRARLEPVAYAEGSGQPEAIAALSFQTIEVDACGLQCPGPIMRLKIEMDKAAVGTTLKVRATDPGFARDAEAWCHLTGNRLVGIEENKGIFEASIQKNAGQEPSVSPTLRSVGKAATLIVFSDDFDRALASFVIANGAEASGKKVTMFFTFLGLSVVKRSKAPRVAKDLMGRMFGAMLPKDAGEYSAPNLPRIPDESCHPFRGEVAGCSGENLPSGIGFPE
jgi:TusA-related sulfurtransferase